MCIGSLSFKFVHVVLNLTNGVTSTWLEDDSDGNLAMLGGWDKKEGQYSAPFTVGCWWGWSGWVRYYRVSSDVRWRGFFQHLLALRRSLARPPAPACLAVWVLWITKAPATGTKRKHRSEFGSCHHQTTGEAIHTGRSTQPPCIPSLSALAAPSTGSKQQWWLWLPCSPLGLLLSTPVWYDAPPHLTFQLSIAWSECELRICSQVCEWVSEWVTN